MRWTRIENPLFFMKRWFIYLVLGAVLFVGGGLLFIDSWAHAAGSEWISFASDRSGNLEIYIMNTNGGDLRRIPTNLGHKDRWPWFPDLAWSPDGRFLAHTAYQDGFKNIYVMDTRTREHRRLTDRHEEEWAPAISPDGKQIAYVARDHEMDRIYKTDANGTDVVELTDPGSHGRPTWSPDGKWIAFVSLSHDRERKGLYVMNTHGKRLRRVLAPRIGTFHDKCAWSPDSKQIAFSAQRAMRYHLCVIDVDGENFRQLTQGGPIVRAKEAEKFPLPIPFPLPEIGFPAWSLDGKWIAYVYSDTIFWQTADIYVIDAEGNGRGKPLVKEAGMAISPVWVSEAFLSVSPNVEKQRTLWGKLKQAAD